MTIFSSSHSSSFAEASATKTRLSIENCFVWGDKRSIVGQKLRGKMVADKGGVCGEEGRSDDVIML